MKRLLLRHSMIGIIGAVVGLGIVIILTWLLSPDDPGLTFLVGMVFGAIGMNVGVLIAEGLLD
jgi:hypothetical protein